MRIPLAVKLFALSLLAVVAGVLTYVIAELYGLGRYGALALAGAVAVIAASAVTAWFSRSVARRIRAVNSGMQNLQGGDYSITLVEGAQDELGEIITLYNKLTDKLRKERQTLHQRELMLDTVIQNANLSLILTDANHRVVYSNSLARQVINRGKPINGLYLQTLLENSHPQLGEMIAAKRDGLFSVNLDGEEHFFHLSWARFSLNTQYHHLLLIKQLTRELSRQEVSTWKKVIRTISHEINNTLAPITSMAHSAGILLKKQKYDQLPGVLNTISERASHLKEFIHAYAAVSKLPAPVKETVEWQKFIQALQGVYPFRLENALPQQPGWFDASQLQQVLVNLFKNAVESGSPEEEVVLSIEHSGGQTTIRVKDRGTGMPPQVMANALLPLYSTKPEGSGVGLSLCREVVEAHDGSLSLSNREGGGLSVRISLPSSEA